MAGRETTSRIGVTVDPAAVTTAQQVGVAGTSVRPSGLAEFAKQVTPALNKLALAGTAKGTEDPSLIGMVTKQVAALGQQLEDMRGQGSLDVRSFRAAKRDALLSITNAFSQSGQAGSTIKEGLTMYRNMISDTYPDSYVQTDTVNGIVTNTIGGETALSSVSAETVQAQTLLGIADTMPQFAQQLQMGLQGLTTNGTPAKNPEALRSATRELMYDQARNLNDVEAKTQHNVALGEAFKSDEFEHQRLELAAKDNRASTIDSFWTTGRIVMSAIRLTEGANDIPLEQKLSSLRAGLMSAAHSPVYEEQALLLGEPALFTNLIKDQMEVAKGIFEATDTVTQMEFDNKEQEVLKKSWNLLFELGLGKQVLPLIEHAENFRNFNGAMLDSAMIGKTVDRPTIQLNVMKALSTGSSLSSYNVQLGFADGARDTPSMIESVGTLTGRLTEAVTQFTSGNSLLTDVGTYKMVLDTMSSPGVKRYLRNPDIPVDVRQGFKEMLLKAETKLQRATGKSREDVEMTYDTHLKIDSIFDLETELPGVDVGVQP